MIIRKAKAEDFKAISEHLFLAMEDILYEFIGMKSAAMAKQMLQHFAKRENNQYSFQNCFVAEIRNEIVASINIYDGAKLDFLREPIGQYIETHFKHRFNPEKETQEGECYIDSFGVSACEQGKGLGTAILQFAIRKYTIENEKTLGLLVDEENPKAKKLYLDLGFKAVGQKVLVGKKMEHLQISNTLLF